jgi:hypothetical protein
MYTKLSLYTKNEQYQEIGKKAQESIQRYLFEWIHDHRISLCHLNTNNRK